MTKCGWEGKVSPDKTMKSRRSRGYLLWGQMFLTATSAKLWLPSVLRKTEAKFMWDSYIIYSIKCSLSAPDHFFLYTIKYHRLPDWKISLVSLRHLSTWRRSLLGTPYYSTDLYVARGKSVNSVTTKCENVSIRSPWIDVNWIFE